MTQFIGSKRQRAFGEYLTPTTLLQEYILPEITPLLTKYIWVDLFAGEGNLILPLLELFPLPERKDFFEKHIFLYDIQPEMVEKSIQRAIKMGIPEALARQNIKCQDTLANYPIEIFKSHLPVFHITNPPYLYIGYIVKHLDTHYYLEYFKGDNEGYQDLYQIALMNDLRHNIPRMVYIIPTNFLFGFSNSNKIRDDFLKFYRIEKAVIFEKELFKHTGVHVAICFFNRKEFPAIEVQEFEGLKINYTVQKRFYRLLPKLHYRAGTEFEEFTARFRAPNPLKVKYYLNLFTLENHKGSYSLRLVNANKYASNKYHKFIAQVSEELYRLVKANPLFLRTLDTGNHGGRAGLYLIPEEFNADGIVVTKSPYRTHPIQVFLEPSLPHEDILLLKDYFNLLLEHFRKLTDSEFMTTYKYSNSKYTRKYLGLTQAKALIETFPYKNISEAQREELRELVRSKDTNGILRFLESIRTGGRLNYGA
ncbi:MAG: N-6 DNA methylase [candidate division WOR-3 bacterium]|nr:N-6 DNA methylase [candidate division WOR-3 bacterium]